MRHIVLVTGSRTWTGQPTIWRALDEIREHFEGHLEMLAVMHGDCPEGADAIADLWCIVNGIEPLRRPADWKRYGKAAGGIRNSEMIAEILEETGADDPEGAEALAFLDLCRKQHCRRPQPHGSHGTVDCITKVIAAGIPRQVFGYPQVLNSPTAGPGAGSSGRFA